MRSNSWKSSSDDFSENATVDTLIWLRTKRGGTKLVLRTQNNETIEKLMSWGWPVGDNTTGAEQAGSRFKQFIVPLQDVEIALFPHGVEAAEWFLLPNREEVLEDARKQAAEADALNAQRKEEEERERYRQRREEEKREKAIRDQIQIAAYAAKHINDPVDPSERSPI